MTDIIFGLINSAINEYKDLSNVSVLNIINKIEELDDRLNSRLKIYNE